MDLRPRKTSLATVATLATQSATLGPWSRGHIMRLATLAIACVMAVTSTAADASRRKKRLASRPAAQAQQMPQDPFQACDLQLRDHIREGGTWLTPTDVKMDEARLTLNVTHAFGQSGRSLPRSIGGDSDDERRQRLRAHLAELREAVEAAKAAKAWFIIASKSTLPAAARSAPGENTSPWYALLLAEIRGRCRTVAQYPNVSVENLPPEVRSEMER
jgi:hypothetical protein